MFQTLNQVADTESRRRSDFRDLYRRDSSESVWVGALPLALLLLPVLEHCLYEDPWCSWPPEIPTDVAMFMAFSVLHLLYPTILTWGSISLPFLLLPVRIATSPELFVTPGLWLVWMMATIALCVRFLRWRPRAASPRIAVAAVIIALGATGWYLVPALWRP